MTAVGIDLGTTFSCIGMWRNNHVEIIANNEGDRITPSYVSYTTSEVLVGKPAQRQLPLNPQNTVYDMKRLIGNRNPKECIDRNGKYWTFKAKHDSDIFVEIDINGALGRIKPEEVSSHILTKLKKSAEEVARQPIKDIVLTVPAYFDDYQKEATIQAAEMAGLNVLELISEPSAAAYAYGYDQKQDSNDNLLIFDLGGGTLDVVIVEVNNGIFKVVTIGGDTQLGGRDFDNALMDYVVDIIEKKYKKKISGNVRIMQRLMKECIDLKHMLSSKKETNLYLGDIFPDIEENIQMDRLTFNQICFNLLHRIEMVIYGTLQETNMTTDQINKIILVGGSSRIPKIKEILEEIFTGVELNCSLNPDEAIAYGATLRAKQMITNDIPHIIRTVEINPKRLENTSFELKKLVSNKKGEFSSFVTEKENNEILEFLGDNCTCVVKAIAEVYATSTMKQSDYIGEGVVCYVRDKKALSVTLRLIGGFSKMSPRPYEIWSFKMEPSTKLINLRSNFATVRLASGDMYSLTFHDDEEGRNFVETVNARQMRRQLHREKFMMRTRESSSENGNHPSVSTTPNGVLDNIGNRFSSTVKKANKLVGSGHKSKKNKITAQDIGMPTNFIYLDHNGFQAFAPVPGNLPKLMLAPQIPSRRESTIIRDTPTNHTPTFNNSNQRRPLPPVHSNTLHSISESTPTLNGTHKQGQSIADARCSIQNKKEEEPKRIPHLSRTETTRRPLPPPPSDDGFIAKPIQQPVNKTGSVFSRFDSARN